MAKTAIEWATDVWNPVTGCSKVSAGCANCFAETVFHRWGQNQGRKFTDVQMHDDRLDAPRHWKKPRRIFVNSMSDLFHGKVSRGFLKSVSGVFMDCPQHIFMILTKRPERAMEYFNADPPPSNVWLGVSVENNAALYRIDILRKIKVAVRFVSFEPLLGKINNIRFSGRGLHWAICGAESGTNRRPFEVDWAESLYLACHQERLKFFMKQDSAFKPGQQGRIPDWLWKVKEFPNRS